MQKKYIITYVIVGFWILLIFFGIFAKVNPDLVSKIPRQKRNEINEILSKADFDILNKKYYDAKNKYISILKTNPNNIEAIIKLSTLYQNTGYTNKAVAFLKDCLKTNKYPYLIYEELANIFQKSGKPYKAINFYRKSLKTTPYGINTYINLSQLYKNTQQWDSLIYVLKTVVKKRTDIKYFYMGALKQNLFVYRNNPDLQHVVKNILQAGVNEKTFAKFDINIFYDCLKNEKNLAIILNKIAFGYASLGDYNKSIYYFRKALKVWPEYMEAKYNLEYLQTQIERQTKKDKVKL